GPGAAGAALADPGPVGTKPPEPAPVHDTQIPSPVRLGELAQATRTAIAVTARQGGTIARIVVHPRELGTVEIRLSYGADGISATVRADSPQAVQALAQGGTDLRQALASHGLDLLDLDIRERHGNHGSHHHAHSHSDSNSNSNPADPDDRHVLPEDKELAPDPRRPPPAGAIDVLAQ